MPATKSVPKSKFYVPYDETEETPSELNELSVSLLPGENEFVRILGVLRYHSFSFGQTTGLLGTLILTNFRIGFRSPYDTKNGQFGNKLYKEGDIVLANIEKIFITTSNGRKMQLLPPINVDIVFENLEIHCKDLRLHIFGFKLTKSSVVKQFLTELVSKVYPLHLDSLFAFQLDKLFLQGNPEIEIVPNFMNRDHWENELARQQTSTFTVTDINTDFTACHSLPPFSAIPKGFLIKSFTTEEERYPVWSCSHHQADLVRVPYTVDISKRSFLEHDIKCRIGVSQSDKQIYDLTGKLPRDLPSLPSARELQTNYEKLRLLCMPTSEKEYQEIESCWYSKLDATRWPHNVLQCLLIATYIAEDMRLGTSILLEEKDHRDWAPLISCLVQLILDPWSRTIKGFESLIQREWVVGGHDFPSRLGLTITAENESKQSPFFLLFLNCVWQLTEQFPCYFEFSEIYLVTLWDTVCLGLFRTFLFPCCEELIRYWKGRRQQTPPTLLSAWCWSHQFSDERLALFRNPLYTLYVDESETLPKYIKMTRGLHQTSAKRNLLIISWHISNLSFWSACFFRWLSPTHFAGGGSGIKHYTRATLIDEMISLGHESEDYETILKNSQHQVTQQAAGVVDKRDGHKENDKAINRPKDNSQNRESNNSSRNSSDSLSRAWSRKMCWSFPFITDNEQEDEDLSLALSLARHVDLRLNCDEDPVDDND